MNLIILTDSDAWGENEYHLSDHRAEHIRAVLKLKEGDVVEVGRLDGPVGTARLTALTPEGIGLKVDGWQEPPDPVPTIRLICALPRPQTLKKILLTSAMMGVESLHLVRANRVEKSFFQSPLIKADNQLPYLLEGLSQGKFTRLPKVLVHDRFRRFFEDSLQPVDTVKGTPAVRLLCDVDAHESLRKVYSAGTNCLTIAIGPEGGWVPFEIDLMRTLGFQPFRLGPWTLRVEHAVTAALAQVELISSINRE